MPKGFEKVRDGEVRHVPRYEREAARKATLQQLLAQPTLSDLAWATMQQRWQVRPLG